MIRLAITGMTCAACSARVEKALAQTSGVTSVSVNLLTNSAKVDGSCSAEALIESVRKAGYDASEVATGAKTQNLARTKTAESKDYWLSRRIVLSGVVLLALFYLCTGVGVLKFPIPESFNNPASLGLLQLCLAGLGIGVNWKIFVNGFTSLRRLNPNMDALVAMGSGVSFLYSTVALFAVVTSYANGEQEKALFFGEAYYFESSVAILFFISIGKSLEARAKGKATSAIDALQRLAPEAVTVIRDNQEVDIPLEEVKIDDVFLVRPGQRIPVDGVVLDGISSVDESALTGESVPVDKQPGASLISGTLNTFGFLKSKATRVGDDTTLAQIQQLTLDASSSKAPIARLADKIAGVFVPTVMGIAALTFVVWLAFGKSWDFALIRGITVLTISCPCALGLATPVAIMVGMGLGAKNGILFKSAETLETLGQVKSIAFDKTGVITTGRPETTDCLVAPDVSEQDLCQVVYALESKSEHPLAAAAVEFVKKTQDDVHVNDLQDFKINPGHGLSGVLNSDVAVGGKYEFVSNYSTIPEPVVDVASGWEREGKTAVFFAHGKKFLGALGISDQIRPEAAKTIATLKEKSLRVLMLTGDSQRVAESIGKSVGISEISAAALPSDKARVIKELSSSGKTLFIGDGINDAPALAQADVGIAIGSGTDVALEAANSALLSNRLDDVVTAIRLSQATMRNIRENLFWAFCYNILGIPLAAGFLQPVVGWTFSPAFGAFAMSMSSLCVVLNSLRLNCLKFKEPHENARCNLPRSQDVQKVTLTFNEKGKASMKKMMKIEGMMCGHCEAHVKKALESLAFVKSATPDHTKGTAVVELKEVPQDVDSALKQAVVDEGYQVVSIAEM